MLHQGLKAELVGHTATQALLTTPGALDRVYPLVIPQKVPRGAAQVPCVVYQQTDWEGQVTYCGTSGLERTIMRLDCYAIDYETTKELARAVKGVLLDFRGMLGGIVDCRYASLESEFDLQDFEPGLYRVTQSWVFWHVD